MVIFKGIRSPKDFCCAFWGQLVALLVAKVLILTNLYRIISMYKIVFFLCFTWFHYFTTKVLVSSKTFVGSSILSSPAISIIRTNVFVNISLIWIYQVFFIAEFEKIEYFREKGVCIPIVSVPPKVSKSIIVPPSFYDGNVLLIDDKEKNVIEWNNAGGIGVLFTDADVSDNLTSVKSLEFLKKIKWNKNIKIVNYFSKFYYVNI